VGINTAVIQSAQGICFAIPINTARWVTGLLIKEGRIKRAYLGITGRNKKLNRFELRRHGLSNESGVEVHMFSDDSPSYRAGMRVGDIIVSINSNRIESIDDIHKYMTKFEIGSILKLRVLRGGEMVDFSVLAEESI
jgi:S1-C subfamily serine protease